MQIETKILVKISIESDNLEVRVMACKLKGFILQVKSRVSIGTLEAYTHTRITQAGSALNCSLFLVHIIKESLII